MHLTQYTNNIVIYKSLVEGYKKLTPNRGCPPFNSPYPIEVIGATTQSSQWNLPLDGLRGPIPIVYVPHATHVSCLSYTCSDIFLPLIRHVSSSIYNFASLLYINVEGLI